MTRNLALHLLVVCIGGVVVSDLPAAAARTPRVQRDIDLSVVASRQGQCTFRWQGLPVAATELSRIGRNALRADVARQGASNVTSFPTVRLKGEATTPYRCISGALREIHRAGLVHVRVMAKRPKGEGARVVVIELPMHYGGVREFSPRVPNRIKSVKNTLGVSQEGQVTWNGDPINLVQLRQYLEIVNTINPVPELHYRPDAEAKLLLLDEVIAVMWRASA